MPVGIPARARRAMDGPSGEPEGGETRGESRRDPVAGAPFLLVRFLWARKENEPVVRGRNPASKNRPRVREPALTSDKSTL